MKRLLVVDDEEVIRDIVRECLKSEYEVHGAEDAVSGRAALAEDVPDVLLTDVRMPGGGGRELVRHAVAHYPDLAVVVVTGYPDIDDFVEFFKMGVADYILKPFSPTELRQAVLRALHTRRLRANNARMRSTLWPNGGASDLLIGESEAMLKVKDQLERVAPTDSTVLLTGASGTGKELAARSLHLLSDRAEGPFVPVHCGALSHDLLESELFGHVRGAFTGADRARAGRFEEADGGTLFLDEIGTMSEAAQVKFLRVLQEREVRRVGDDEPRYVNVRVVAATNANLAEMVDSGEFRRDLHFRLDVFPIKLPPLADRIEDVPLLAHFLLEKCSNRLGLPPRRLSQDAVRCLTSCEWPGNVRELENVMERAIITAGSDEVIERADLLLASNTTAHSVNFDLPDEGVDLPALLADLEFDLIEQALSQTTSRQEAATLLGLQRTTLVQKLRRRDQAKLELEVEEAR